MRTTITFLVALLVSTSTIAQYAIASYSSGTYNDISTSGTNANLGDDEEYNITLPFTVYIGTTATTSLRIGNNGAVLFDTTTGDVSPTNTALSTSSPMIAPFWDDFDSEVGGVYYETVGFGFGRKFIIQWDRVYYMSGSNTNSNPASFQIIFNESSGVIIFHYNDVDLDGTANDQGVTATVGIATADEVTQFSFNTASLSADLELAFDPTNTYVPDNNFEAYLETHKADGTVVAVGDPNSMGNGIANDDFVTTANISGVTMLDVSNKSIANLMGIADFTALTTLDCHDNSLTAIDISANTALTNLDCGYNSLTSLDVSANTALTVLSCYWATLTSLDVSTNLALENLDCSYNSITSIDVSANPALTNLNCYSNELTTLNIANGHNNTLFNMEASSNVNLSCIQVDDASNAPPSGVLWFKDPSASYSDSCHNGETYVPDDNFETYLETHKADGTAVSVGDASSMGNGTNYDDFVTTANISSVTTLDVSSENIADFTGIEDFTSLTNLDCSGNQLTNLDMSGSTALTELVCNNNQLTNINITSNTALTELNCNYNQLLNLHISSNTALTSLQCSNNRLTSLNTSTNVALIDLYCQDNQLTNIDVSTNTALTFFECGDNSLTSLNVNANTALSFLKCNNSQLTSLNLSANTALTSLQCNNNQLTNLNVSNNTSLTVLICDDNQLTSLDIRSNTALYYLECQNNSLTGLNLKNGNNSGLTTMNATGNSSLVCIEVDNASNIPAAWQKDATASYSNNCHYGETYVPDNNFEHYLETHTEDGTPVAVGNTYSLGNGVDNDDYVDTAQISTVTMLEIESEGIADLTGIEDFAALQLLNCNDNLLTDLDISSLTTLTELYCNANLLTGLNLKNGNNSNMTDMDATSNPNLTCIQVDDAANTPPIGAIWLKDAGASYNNDCSSLGYDDVTNLSFMVYPNPVKDSFTIQTQDTILSVKLYDYLGKQVALYNKQDVYSTNQLSSGIYLIKVTTEKAYGIKRIIIE